MAIVFYRSDRLAELLPDLAALDLVARTEAPRVRWSPHQPVISPGSFLQELARRTGRRELSSGAAGLRGTFRRVLVGFRRRYVPATSHAPRSRTRIGAPT